MARSMTKNSWLVVATVMAAGALALALLWRGGGRGSDDAAGAPGRAETSAGSTLEQALVESEPGLAHPLAGQTVDLRILGIANWAPSEVAGAMAVDFAEYARKTHGYDVQVAYRGASFTEMFDLASSFLAAGSQEYNLIIIDSQWMGAFAEAGWIANVNQLVESHQSLDIEWWDPVIEDAYMEYPAGSGRFWAMPFETNAMALYVRRDLFEDPQERSAFRAHYGRELPREFGDFERLTMTEFEDISEFFTRPEKNLYGTAMQYSEIYDFASMFLYPFIWSSGGRVWDPRSQQIHGVLDSPENAAAMARYRAMLRYQPPDAVHYGISEVTDAFVSGKVATAFHWCAAGPSMGDPDRMLVVPPPMFERPDGTRARIYPIGGQPWAINAHNDVAHMRMLVDFMVWWYSPQIQRTFAQKGGNPATKAIISDPAFNAMQPWFRTLTYMLNHERGRDFWHHPAYAEMLAVQQSAFVAYAQGRIDDAMLVLEYIASQQQAMVHRHDPGGTGAPPADTAAIQRRYESALRR